MNVYTNTIAKHNGFDRVEINEKQYEVQNGDIFFTTSSETPNEVGMSSMWVSDESNVYLNSFCFGFRPKVLNNKYYFAYMLRSPYIRTKIVFFGSRNIKI